MSCRAKSDVFDFVRLKVGITFAADDKTGFRQNKRRDISDSN
jgi:hypothetical protein